MEELTGGKSEVLRSMSWVLSMGQYVAGEKELIIDEKDRRK